MSTPLQDLKLGNFAATSTMGADGEAGVEAVDPVTKMRGTYLDQKDMHRMGKLQQLQVSLSKKLSHADSNISRTNTRLSAGSNPQPFVAMLFS